MFEKLTQKYINQKIKWLRKNEKLFNSNIKLKDGYAIANHKKLDHIFLCVGGLPEYYTDKPFTCRDCGSNNVWTAAKQKHYFEEFKGKHLEALAIRCRKCREVKNLKKKQQQIPNKNKTPMNYFLKN